MPPSHAWHCHLHSLGQLNVHAAQDVTVGTDGAERSMLEQESSMESSVALQWENGNFWGLD